MAILCKNNSVVMPLLRDSAHATDPVDAVRGGMQPSESGPLSHWLLVQSTRQPRRRTEKRWNAPRAACPTSRAIPTSHNSRSVVSDGNNGAVCTSASDARHNVSKHQHTSDAFRPTSVRRRTLGSCTNRRSRAPHSAADSAWHRSVRRTRDRRGTDTAVASASALQE